MDLVVTLPKSFGLKKWIGEGDPAGTRWSGEEWGWFMGGRPPKNAQRGDRVYVIYDGMLIGFSPLIRIQLCPGGRFALVRGGQAMAVTLAFGGKDHRGIKGFQGYRYRWWERDSEVQFDPKLLKDEVKLREHVGILNRSIERLRESYTRG